MPPILLELRKRLPDLNIRVFDNSKLEIDERVYNGEEEFGITPLQRQARPGWSVKLRARLAG